MPAAARDGVVASPAASRLFEGGDRAEPGHIFADGLDCSWAGVPADDQSLRRALVNEARRGTIEFVDGNVVAVRPARATQWPAAIATVDRAFPAIELIGYDALVAGSRLPPVSVQTILALLFSARAIAVSRGSPDWGDWPTMSFSRVLEAPTA